MISSIEIGKKLKKSLTQITESARQNAGVFDKAQANDSWYRRSYPVTLGRFKETRDAGISGEVERTLLVGAWVATILAPNFSNDDIYRHRQLVAPWLNNDLWLMSDVRFERLIQATDCILRSTNVLLNSSRTAAYRPNYPTVTKYLHFECPKLFPILDKNINSAIRGSILSMDSYSRYLRCLRDLSPDLVKKLRVIGNRQGVSPLRIIDICLFRSQA